MNAAAVAETPIDLNSFMPKWSSYIPHQPTPKQHAALLLDGVRELLYGGAAGGGKSDFLLMAALQYVDVPGYSALLLRRTFPQLIQADSLLPRAMGWLGGKATGTNSVSGMPTKWTFPSGATIEFRHCQREADKFDFQSGAWQFMGFDELTQFPVGIYLYLMSRLRRLEGMNVPLRVRAASNPGGRGHGWVMSRFPIDTRSGDVAADPDRVFISAKLTDNPHLDGTQYAETLSLLPEYERRQLMDGDWTAKPPGSKFKREWFMILPEAPADIADLTRYWDLASTEQEGSNDPDWTVGVKMGRTPDGKYPILHVDRFRGTPSMVEDRIAQRTAMDGLECKVIIEQEPGSAGKFTIATFTRLLAGYNVHSSRPTGDKYLRMNPLAAQCEAGNVPLVNGVWVEDFLQEVEHIPNSEHDDQGDAASGAFEEIALPSGITPTDLYGPIEDEEDK